MSIQRFTFGGWPEPIAADRWRILYSHPERHKEIVQLLNEGLNAPLRALAAAANQRNLALIEARYQHDQLSGQLQSMSYDLEDALKSLEISLGGHLSEIKLILSQIDKKLAYITNILLTPLGTKANEMVADGARALSRGYIDEAVKCFEEALEHKPSDFRALTFLGFSNLELHNITASISSFKSAVAFAPEDSENKALTAALDNLARVYYVNHDYLLAYENAKKCLNFQKAQGHENLGLGYRYAVYCFLANNREEGLKQMISLCEKNPSFYLPFLTDNDLLPFRKEIEKHLNELCQKQIIQTAWKLKNLKNHFHDDIFVRYSRFPSKFKEISTMTAILEIVAELLHPNGNEGANSYTQAKTAESLLDIYESFQIYVSRLIQLRVRAANAEKTCKAARLEYKGKEAFYYEASRKYTALKSAKISNSENAVKISKRVVYVVITILGLYLFGDVVISEINNNNIFVILTAGLLLFAIFLVIIVVAAFIAGFIVSTVINEIGEIFANRQRKKVLDMKPPNAEREIAEKALEGKNLLENALSDAEKRVGELVIQTKQDIDRLKEDRSAKFKLPNSIIAAQEPMIDENGLDRRLADKIDDIYTIVGKPLEKREIKEIINHPSVDKRIEAFKALSCQENVGQGWTPKLINALLDSSNDVRIYAAIILRDYGLVTQDAMANLTENLKSKTTFHSVFVRAIREIDKTEPTVLPYLLRYAKDGNSNVRIMSVDLLRHYGKAENVISTLLDSLEDSNDWVRIIAAEILGELNAGHDMMIDTASKYLNGSNSAYRVAAIVAFGNCGQPSKKYLSDIFMAINDPEVSYYYGLPKAIEQIDSDGDQVIPYLTELLKSDERWQRDFAIRCVHQYGRKARTTIPKLIELLGDKSNQMAVADALFAIDD